jgi:hypothetical protein
MAIPVRSRWWILTLAIVGVLVLISMLALDRPNVVWAGYEPHCPHCRNAVRFYAQRCAECRADFDWVVAPEEDSPISQDSLSVLEAAWLHERVAALGAPEAARRVSQATGVSVEAAGRYLGGVARGDCGWCGGTRRDLAAPEEGTPCPVCFGTGRSIACAGDRRVRLGDASARRALDAYEEDVRDLLEGSADSEARVAEARKLNARFLASHAGTTEASRLLHWPAFAAPQGPDEGGGGTPPRATDVARQRLQQIVEALR